MQDGADTGAAAHGGAGSASGDRRRGLAVAWLAWWVVLAALYLLLVDNTVLPELITGAVVAAVGATGAVLVRGQRRILLRPQPRWLLDAWRPLLGLLTDLVPLARVLVTRGILRRPAPSGLVELPYAHTGDDPTAAAHRAFTQALGSLAPNTLVVDIDEERGVLLAHQLERGDDAATSARPLRP
jgi:multisubunit Na+/H+ antiporter MnhE subunit